MERRRMLKFQTFVQFICKTKNNIDYLKISDNLIWNIRLRKTILTSDVRMYSLYIGKRTVSIHEEHIYIKRNSNNEEDFFYKIARRIKLSNPVIFLSVKEKCADLFERKHKPWLYNSRYSKRQRQKIINCVEYYI